MKNKKKTKKPAKSKEPKKPVEPIADVPPKKDQDIERQRFLLLEAEKDKARLEVLEDVLRYVAGLRDAVRDRANLAVMELQKTRDERVKEQELEELRKKVAAYEGRKGGSKAGKSTKGDKSSDSTSGTPKG